MKKLADEPVTLLMITDEEADMIEEFVEGFKMPGWVVIDEDRSTFDAFDVSGVPRTFVISPEGKLLFDIKSSELTADLVRKAL